MTWLLRVVLIVVSVLTTVVILKKVRQAKMRIEDSVFWIGFFFLLIVFSVFPQIVYAMSALAGTMTPANFIYLFVIFVLILRLFRITVKLSQLETKVAELVQQMAIDENLRREGERGRRCPEMEEKKTGTD